MFGYNALRSKKEHIIEMWIYIQNNGKWDLKLK